MAKPWWSCSDAYCPMCVELNTERGPAAGGAAPASPLLACMAELEQMEGSVKAAAIECGITESGWSHLKRRLRHGLTAHGATSARIRDTLARARIRKAIEIAGRASEK